MIGNRTFRCVYVRVWVCFGKRVNKVFSLCISVDISNADRKEGGTKTTNANANHICKCSNHYSLGLSLGAYHCCEHCVFSLCRIFVCLCVMYRQRSNGVIVMAVAVASVLPVHWDLFRLLLVMHRSVTIQFCQMAY